MDEYSTLFQSSSKLKSCYSTVCCFVCSVYSLRANYHLLRRPEDFHGASLDPFDYKETSLVLKPIGDLGLAVVSNGTTPSPLPRFAS